MVASSDGMNHVFHRDFNRDYPLIAYGEGIYLVDKKGKRYMDASSGAIAANLGHGVTEIGEAMAAQAKQAGFVHTLRFETEVQHELAQAISQLAPRTLNHVYFTSTGSEANESAIKFAIQYHRDRGNSSKTITIGRWQSYHGNTMGSLSAGGDVLRRTPYLANLMQTEHVHSPYCHRCPYQRHFDQCKVKEQLDCVEEVERLIQEIGPENVASFICEPIIGSQQGAVVPPDSYLSQVRALCDRYDILLIIDEVMTGFGRTGHHFAIEAFKIEPDIITFGKGVSGGYAPLAGMIVSDRLVDSLKKYGKGKFIHGSTFSGHPVSLAAGRAALRYYKRHRLLDNSKKQGAYLLHKLHGLRDKHRTIGNIRGRGLLIGFEMMRDRHTDTFYEPTDRAAEQLNQIAMRLGVIFYPGSGTLDGIRGDHLLIGPPLTINETEVDELVYRLSLALVLFEQE
ncbi:aminotransferase class III-fold pyridoxal phosphate-dependent enzyme [Paenibacillus sp. N1-5-1-14]|uniref:aminotransferase family protein n=1 Tax=Paenibacillus radicibacter TaxID=2972488 RepID=UPI002158D91F|nr:aminotransferase class III-fold pyridoxal phosphate-dependent enzyme [Paenibacillus radicibacter]MCR8641053.1 aminotransferase class III-fold pyridoxal phosphate-dependent enzyme [Paenibacillus radicibacter]